MKKVLALNEEHDFVLDWCRKNPCISVLDGPAHDAFAKQFNAPTAGKIWGPDPCPRLSKRISELYKAGRLERARIGLSGGAWQPGFPTWVWTYSIPPEWRKY